MDIEKLKLWKNAATGIAMLVAICVIIGIAFNLYYKGADNLPEKIAEDVIEEALHLPEGAVSLDIWDELHK